MLSTLCVDKGISGREYEMTEIIKNLLDDCARVETDNSGNIIASLGDKNADKHIMLDAHIDRIGLTVTYIGEGGFVKAEPVGGIDLRTLPGSAVTIVGKENVTAVICTEPPHLSKGDAELSRDKIWIDTGLGEEKVREIISPRDSVYLYGKPTRLLNDIVAAPALDNRAGVAVLIKTARLLNGKQLPVRLSLVFTVQEETGELGAGTSAFSLAPDEAIIVDADFAEQDGVKKSQSGPLGKCVMLTLSPTVSKKMNSRLKELAGQLGIELAYEVTGGATGTDADRISFSRGGVRTAVLSYPLKNMHTQCEAVSLCDLENTARLLAEYVLTGGLDL